MQITKMHGLGNDFILYYPRNSKELGYDYSYLASKMCARRLGIGADGLILVLKSEKCDIQMKIFNADGSEAEMCGNGIRCFAKYVYEKGIVKKTDMTIETLAGVIKPKLIVEDGIVTLISVDMGVPIFEPREIPVSIEKDSLMNYSLKIEEEEFNIAVTNTGVPHTMVFVDKIDNEDVYKFGPIIEKHDIFPKNTNVNFVEIIDKNNIKVSTWERGAGKTMACGTGCCAAVVACYERNFCERKTRVELQAGYLDIEYKEDQSVIMTGPATTVFEGVYFTE